MAEAAGAAVGVISLGIQVCQGLYTYCSAIKGRSQDIEDISKQIQGLESTFRALANIIPRTESLPSANVTAIASLQKCIANCDEGVKQLEEFLTSIGGPPREGVKGKIKDAGQKLAFGFRRGEIPVIQQKVQLLTTTAEFALQILTLDLGLGHSEDVAQLSVAMGSKLSFVETEIASTSTAVLVAVSEAREDTKMDLALVSEEIQSRIGALERLVTSQHEQINSHFLTTQVQSTTTSTRLLHHPAMLHEACDIVNYSSVCSAGSRDTKRQGTVSSRCDCDSRERKTSMTTKRVRLGNTILSDEYFETSRHFKDCPFYLVTRAQRRVTGQFCVGVWRELSMLVHASLSCTTGAGGFSISPQLSFQLAVANHPAENLIYNAFYGRPSTSNERTSGADMIKAVASAEREILKMFQNREVSPFDRLPDGSTILHDLMNCCSTVFLFTDERTRDQLIWQVVELVRSLILAGVPSNEVDLDQRTPLDMLMSLHWPSSPTSRIDRAPNIKFVEAVSNIFPEPPALNRGSYSPVRTLTVVMDSPSLIRDLGLPLLATAIMNNSETGVRSALAKSPQSILELTYGMTVLHLSSQWPAGLSILLSAGAVTMIDNTCCAPGSFPYPLSAVDLAIHFRCEGGVRVLLEAGCDWNMFNMRFGDTTSLACVRVVAHILADRRRSLMRLAEETLTEIQLSSVSRQTGLLDSDAATVVRLLRGAGVEVSAALAVPHDYEGIYLSGNLNIAHFRTFFDSDFRDIDRRDSKGRLVMQLGKIGGHTPLGANDIGESIFAPGLSSWLRQRGLLKQSPTDPLMLGVNTTATGWHILAFRLAKEGYFRRERFLIPPLLRLDLVYGLFKDIFETRLADSCRCPCSSAGCLPFTTCFKALSQIQSHVFSTAPQFMTLGDGHGQWQAFRGDLTSELLRFLTFEALEMTHTCCSGGSWSNKDSPLLWDIGVLRNFPGSIKEIRAEEEEFERRLDTLLSEFEARLQESGEDIQDFVWGYWKRRMREECVPVYYEDAADAADTGVRFERDYKTPYSLRLILGRDFDLAYECPTD